MRRNDIYKRAIERFGDAREKQLELMLYRDYQKALIEAIGKYKAFLVKLDDVMSGQYQPPDYYTQAGPEAVERWKRGFATELLRRGQVIEDIAKQLSQAGQSLPNYVRDVMADIYTFDHAAALGLIGEQAGMQMTLSGINKAAARVLYQSRETPLTQIAFQRYANPADIEDQLRREFLIAISTGESTKKLTQRIADVTDGKTLEDYVKHGKDPLLKACKSVVRYEMNCAKRIAQTERTRVQNQASYDATQKAADMGVRVVNEWSCQMIPATEKSSGSRETHIKLNGQRRPQGVPFDLSDGDKLMYPGDPRGKACNVINCHCTLIPVVLLPGE